MARFGLIIGVAAVVSAIALGAGVAMAARSNDDIKHATRVRQLPHAAVAVDTLNATKQEGEPQPSCLVGAGKDVSQSVWYRIDINRREAGMWDIDTAGSTYDTVMTLYRAPRHGKATFDELVVVDCNDDNFLGQTSSAARFFVDLTPGRYYIQVGDYDTPGSAPHMTSLSIDPIANPD